MCSTFPPIFKQTFAFQPFRLFRCSFWDNSNSVSLCFRLLVYKWSHVYPTLVRIHHWQMARSKHLNEGMLISSDLELPALPYVAPITTDISRLPEYWLYNVHEIVWWPCGKVICHSQKYTRDHWDMWRKALDFMQSLYTALQSIRHQWRI